MGAKECYLISWSSISSGITSLPLVTLREVKLPHYIVGRKDRPQASIRSKAVSERVHYCRKFCVLKLTLKTEGFVSGKKDFEGGRGQGW